MLVHISTQLRSKAVVLAITLAATSVAFGQTTAEETSSRVLQFAHNGDPQSLTEAATVIRSTGNIQYVKVEAPSRTLTLRGTAGQIALAEWLFSKLDQPSTAQHPAMQDYKGSGMSGGAVRILYPTRTETHLGLMELITTIRTITAIPGACQFSVLNAVVLRGTPDELAIAEWLFNELDQRTDSHSASQEYRPSNAGDDVVRVFYLTHAKTPAEFQESANLIRRTTGIRRMFTYTAPRALTVRGTANQVAEAKRLIEEHSF